MTPTTIYTIMRDTFFTPPDMRYPVKFFRPPVGHVVLTYDGGPVVAPVPLTFYYDAQGRPVFGTPEEGGPRKVLLWSWLPLS